MATCGSSWSPGFAAVATPCPRRAAGSITSASRSALGSRYTARLIPSLKSSSPPSSHCDKFATYWRRSAKATVTPARVETRCALDTGATNPDDNKGPSFGLGATRLKRIIQSGSENFVLRFNKSRKNFPTKIFLLLLGYYSANALATVLGQTGDWDVLAAGILVALIEGVGYLMYRMPAFLGDRGKDMVTLMNFYKNGFSFGLFVDAFKLGS